jgi:dephospho-CoA kinase
MVERNTWPLPVLGLTGSIASGKSEAGRIFAALGAEVIDADGLLREVTRRGRPAHREIVRRFGRGVLTAAGGISRRKLAAEVFGDPGKRAALEAITHRRIMKAADARIRRIGARRFVPVFLEAALLVETGLYRMLDGLVVVVCDRRLQVERLRESRGLGEDQIRLRLDAQMPWRAKARAADWIVENNADLHALRAAVEAVMARILRSAPYLAKRKAWRPAR